MRTTPGHNLRGRLTPTFAASPVEALALGGPMPSPGALPVRPARRTDVARLTELRLWYLAETARLEPRLRLQAEARERIAQAVSSWIEHQHRVLLVAETAGEEGGAPQVVGYATGLFSVWPPIWRAQHVGEVSECFVVPQARGKGAGRALLEGLVLELSRRGADVLRAPVPVKNDGSVALFHAAGFAPHMRVLERPAGTR